MWTKRYILNPTKDEYFKKTQGECFTYSHPIATGSVLAPMLISLLIIGLAGADRYNWWIAVEFVGSLIFGIGLSYSFAVMMKIYQKVWLPILFLILGLILIVVSFIFLF